MVWVTHGEVSLLGVLLKCINMSYNPLKNTFGRNIRNFLWGSFGSVIALLSFGHSIFNLSINCSIVLGIVSIIVLFLIRFLYYLFKDLARYIHNVYVDSIWGYAIIKLKDAYSEMHYLRKQKEIKDQDFMNALVTFCETLKKIFDKKTKGDCCVSIKVPAGVFDSLETWQLRNLCRDSKHNNRDTQVYDNTEHTVIGNTPYTVIVSKLLDNRHRQKPFYLNNDIENSKDYMNTSKQVYEKGLPYKSELVYAIVPIKKDEKSSDLVGFLCIDCDKKNVFDDNRYDIPMIEGVVDGIYDIILRRNQEKLKPIN